jgi:cytochrome P450
MESCYIPFGSGARLCLGKVFALAEIKLLIAGIVMEYNICADPKSGTTDWSMGQLGTQNALPRGQRCDLSLSHV